MSEDTTSEWFNETTPFTLNLTPFKFEFEFKTDSNNRVSEVTVYYENGDIDRWPTVIKDEGDSK